MHSPAAPRRLDERGNSATVLVTVAMSSLFLVAGLVVDGGAQVRAHRLSEVAAARAVRSGTDAMAARRLVGQDGTADGLSAARAALATDQVTGEVGVEDGRLHVVTHTSTPTIFLSLLGIDEVHADGEATAELQPV